MTCIRCKKENIVTKVSEKKRARVRRKKKERGTLTKTQSIIEK